MKCKGEPKDHLCSLSGICFYLRIGKGSLCEIISEGGESTPVREGLSMSPVFEPNKELIALV